MRLPPFPHAWDDDLHRTAILTAFEIWSVLHENGDPVGAERWQQTLRTLTEEAPARRAQQQRQRVTQQRRAHQRQYTVRAGRKVAT